MGRQQIITVWYSFRERYDYYLLKLIDHYDYALKTVRHIISSWQKFS